jgi:hypothetical protein
MWNHSFALISRFLLLPVYLPTTLKLVLCCPLCPIIRSVCLLYSTTVLLRANSHIPCRSHAVPTLFPCHALPLRVYIISFPFDLHRVAVFDSHTPCRTRVMPRPCRSESDFSRPRHSAVWHVWISISLPETARGLSARYWLSRGVPRRLLSVAYQSIKL